MKTRKIRSNTSITQVIDSDTGELLDESVDTAHFFLNVDSNESFFMVYASAVSALSGGLSALDEKLLRWICMEAGYNSNRISLQKNIKEEFAKKHGVKLQSVSNSVHNLKSKGVIVPQGNGNYIINPNMFWKGSRGERVKNYEFYLSVVKEYENKKTKKKDD